MQPHRPTSVLVIAILQFVFGGLSLVMDVCGGAVQVAGGNAMFTPGGGSAQATKQAQLTKQVERLMEERVPANKAIGLGGLGLDVLLSILMIVSGIGLLQMRPWGRSLTIAYGFCSLLLKVIGCVIAFTLTVPAMREVARIVSQQGREEAMTGQFLEIAAIATPILMVLAGIYPIIALTVMFRRNVSAAFAGQPVPSREHEDYDDRPRVDLPRRDDGAPPDDRFTGR